MNIYRVDRNDELKAPCGMNSILYCGDSYNQAVDSFKRASIGLDFWNRSNTGYGVILSKWSYEKRDYIVIQSKGITL